MISCYDLIFHSTNSLDSQRPDIYFLTPISMLDTSQHMSHTIRTTYGDSNITNGGDIIPNNFKHLMLFLCHEKCSAHQIWLIISPVAFSALLSQGFGIHSSDSFTKEVAQLVGFSYVDNCKMVQLDDYVEANHLQMQPTILE